MKHKVRCVNCSERSRCRDDFWAWIFFIIGLIATVAIRVVTVLMHVNPFYGQIAWYVGVVGFLLFFIYKFRIYARHSKVIREKDLVAKIEEKQALSEEERRLLSGILCGLSSKKESINYFFIFFLSAVALLIAVFFDFIKGG